MGGSGIEGEIKAMVGGYILLRQGMSTLDFR